MDLPVFVVATLVLAALLLTVWEVLSPRPRSRWRGRIRGEGSSDSLPAVAAGPEREAGPGPMGSAHEPVPGRPPEPVRPAELVASECRELFAEQRVEEALAMATAALPVPPAEATAEHALLWRLIAEARGRLGDRPGAQAAWQHALAAAPEPERETYRRQFVDFVIQTARRLVTEMRLVDDSGLRLREFGIARALLAAGRREGVDAPAVAELETAVADGYWAACEAELRALVDAQAFEAAARLADEALIDPELPPARRDIIVELRALTRGSARSDEHLDGSA